MPTTITLTVPAGKVPERLDVFLTHSIENATRTKVQEAIKKELVLINGKPTKSSHKVSGGEVVAVTLPKNPPPDVVPENIPLDIVFEDEYLLIVNKPAGMVVHPAYGNYTGTLVNALLYHYNHLSSINDATRPGIVHRLDKNTSGLLVVAKDDFTHAKLAKQFFLHTIEREYRAVVWGVFPSEKKKSKSVSQKSGTIEAALGRSKQDRKKVTVREDGKQAITEYVVLGEFEYLSLLQLKLRTGRTHQIRAHLFHIGHPVFGDPEYGGRRVSWGEGGSKHKAEVKNLLSRIGRQALHAKTLGFIHPKTNQSLRFESELPPDMSSLVEEISRK
ncbi:MAG: RluA family pseudouridine synthase [Ignavibacteriales bacterium]|nr:RluA family pseudouridine synthase [Ignavibacteriales bacterium]